MKQIEITAQLLGDLNTQVNLLQRQGFTISKRARVEDEYLTQHSGSVNEGNVVDVLAHSVLLRHLKENDKIYRQITYKKKEYLNNQVIGEEKYNIPCDDLMVAQKLFIALGFHTLVNVRYDVIEVQKGAIRFAFQNVEGLGVLVECESPQDCSNMPSTEISQEKEKLYQLLKSFGLPIGPDINIQKAKELVLKKFS